jgi:PhnB protein
MAGAAFYPYLFFGGNCRAAFTRYEEIFGGENFMMSMAEAPDQGDVPADKKDYIIHAALKFENGSLLMGSDDPMTDSFGPVQGMQVTYSTEDVDDAKRVYESLAKGGTSTQPLIETFFSPAFGMVTDEFGTPWMVVAESPEEHQQQG